MTPRMVATAGAFTSLLFGAAGLAVPTAMASGFGISLDATGVGLARLACASYVGFGVLAWLARDLTDPDAWRAVAAAQAVGWGLAAVVVVVEIPSRLGDARAWAMVALQVLFTLAWLVAFLRASSVTGHSPSSPAQG